MADTTLWPWESHSISAFRLFTLGWKNDRVFRWPMAVPAQNSKVPVLAPPGPGPDSGGGALGGPTWLWASEQAWLERAATSAPGRHRERISPGRAYLHCGHARLGHTWAGPLCQHPTRRPRRRPKAEGTPLPSEARPGHLPASFPRSGPRRPGHPRPEPIPAAGTGRSPPRSYLAERPGKPREPRPRGSGPGSREQEAAERGREDEALTAAEEEPVVWGHLLAGRTERTARAGPETVQKAGGRVLLLRAGLRGRGGGGEGWWWPSGDVRPAGCCPCLCVCLLSVC